MIQAMGDADMLHAAMRRTGDFSLLKFLPAATLSVTSVAAGPERCRNPINPIFAACDRWIQSAISAQHDD